LLRTLKLLPTAIVKKIGITPEGKPLFGALSDAEFNVVLRAVRRVYPQYANPAWNIVLDPPERKTPSNSTLRLTQSLHGRVASGTTH
jgi:hypothetical protein